MPWMETAVTILRELWRARREVALSASIALAVGLLVVYRPVLPNSIESRRYEVGVASPRMLLATPASQVVAVAPTGGADLGGHASLLANLMGEGDVKATIARRAGLTPSQLVTVTPAVVGTKQASPAGARGPGANI